MSFQAQEPILVIGLGGAGSRLAFEAKKQLNSDCLIISNNSSDFKSECTNILVSTNSIVNPSVQSIRGFAGKSANEIESKVSEYQTIILMANLAGKAGAAISPLVSKICKESGKNLLSFAIMPFKYEKDRIFNSGVSLKRVREDSTCTIILDNDALLDSNPDLSVNQCYEIANSAILYVVNSIPNSEFSTDSNLLTTSSYGKAPEESLRDSLKMLYENAPPNAIKRSILYVSGGSIPVGVINSITTITSDVLDQSNSQINIDTTTHESKIVMLSTVQGQTKFDSYDPLNIIPKSDTLDWTEPDCSIDCKLDLYQLE